MKKTQLRKIIKESIKQLMIEQQTPPPPSTDCVKQDFKYNAICSQQHLHSAPGSKQMWKRRLRKQKNKFLGNAGCYQFGAINNWITNQLDSGVTGNGDPLTTGQINMKTAFRSWAGCMMDQCRVPGATIRGC